MYLFLQGLGNVLYKKHQKPRRLTENQEKNFDATESKDARETFPTPPQVAMCSPPMSVVEDEEDISYSLMPQFSRNSSPTFYSPEEVPDNMLLNCIT